MISRVVNGLGYVVFAAAAWWVWNGPLHDMRTVTAEEQLQVNAEEMARCLHGMAYVEGAGSGSSADPEAACARKLNLYRHEGQWYSHSTPRPGSSAHNG